MISTEGIQADDELYAKADLSILSGKKIGVTIQPLRNAYWAGVMSALENVLTENGAEYTIVACDNNSSTQIGQIENFISAGCDLIMVHPSDANAVEDICAEAKNSGISSSTTSNWILTAILYSCSVESGLTGSKRSITRETASAFYTNGMKMGASNGRGPAKKQNSSLNSRSGS